MSAAKKLRALEVTGPFVEAGFMPPQTAEKLRRMHDALPQIAALVEAAERVDARKDEEAWRLRPARMRDLRAALAALDEALQ